MVLFIIFSVSDMDISDAYKAQYNHSYNYNTCEHHWYQTDLSVDKDHIIIYCPICKSYEIITIGQSKDPQGIEEEIKGEKNEW